MCSHKLSFCEDRKNILKFFVEALYLGMPGTIILGILLPHFDH